MLKSWLSQLSSKLPSQLSGQPMHHAVFSRRGFLRCGAMAKPLANKQVQKGFTLLEMLVVIGLVGIMALASISLSIDDADVKRQEETEKRWDAIRKAIIGETNLSLNGAPYVAGYVADMGRLPLSVSELIEQNVQFDNNDDGVDDTLCTFDPDNNGAATLTIRQPAFSEIAIATNYIANTAGGYTNTISGGWRGPYLYTAGSSFYGDGWFNQDTDDACDFNWRITTTPTLFTNLTNIETLRIQSLGSDRNVGGSDDRAVGGNDTARDYPANNLNMVNLNEWTLGANITVNVLFNRAAIATDVPTTNPLQLKIYRYIDNGDDTVDAGDIDETVADTTFEMSVGLTQAPAQTIDLSGLPIGRFTAVIWCTGNDNLPLASANYTNDVVYDGDCSGGNISHSPVYFTVTQHTTQVTITWNLP